MALISVFDISHSTDMIKKFASNRRFALSVIAATLATSTTAVRAQVERKAAAASAAPAESVAADAAPATIEEPTAGQRAAAGANAQTFKVTARGQSSVISVKSAGGNSEDAILTIDGQEVRISAKNAFDVKKPVVMSSLAKGSKDFWACIVASMVKQIGQAAWDKIKNNYQTMWNNTSGKFWQRVLQFLKQAFTLPYGSYLVSALKTCS